MADEFKDANFTGDVTTTGDLTVGDNLLLGGSGTNRLWKVYLPASAGVPTTTGGCAALAKVEFSTYADVSVLAFDQTSAESSAFQVALPADYDGSTLRFRVFWTASAGTSGDVIWQIRPHCVANDGSLNVTFTATATLTDTFLAQEDVHVISGTATPDNAAASALMTMRVSRAANVGGDTFNADALLLGLEISYA